MPNDTTDSTPTEHSASLSVSTAANHSAGKSLGELRCRNLFVLSENGTPIPLSPEFVRDGSTHRHWRRVKGADGEWYDHAGEDAKGRWTYRHTDHDNRNIGRLVG